MTFCSPHWRPRQQSVSSRAQPERVARKTASRRAANALRWVKIAAGARTVEYVGANLDPDRRHRPDTAYRRAGQRRPIVHFRAASEARAVGGIYVRKDSPVKTQFADLAGKTISLSVLVVVAGLLATALDRAGLTWNDIVPLDLHRVGSHVRHCWLATSLRGFQAEDFSAAPDESRPSPTPATSVTNPSVFFARRDFADDNPNTIADVASALHETDRWIAQHPADAAAILARVAGGRSTPPNGKSISPSAHRASIRSTIGSSPSSRRRADLFFRFGLLPRTRSIFAMQSIATRLISIALRNIQSGNA